MESSAGTDHCPVCETVPSVWTLLNSRHRRVRCEHCGASLVISGIRSAVVFDSLIAYPISALIGVGMAFSNLMVGLTLAAAMLVGSSYLSVRMFYRIHSVDRKGQVTE